MGILFDKHITSAPNQVCSNIFEGFFSPQDFTSIAYTTSKDYVRMYWDKFQEYARAYRVSHQKPLNQSVNGNIFEYIIQTLLIRENILPFYSQATMSFIPAIEFDIILYSEDDYGVMPYLLSLKTSFRERWKQADLEAEALKKVHRRAKCYLLTMETDDAQSVKEKIAIGEAFAIDDAIDCNSDDLDNLIAELNTKTFIESLPTIRAVKSGHFIQ